MIDCNCDKEQRRRQLLTPHSAVLTYKSLREEIAKEASAQMVTAAGVTVTRSTRRGTQQNEGAVRSQRCKGYSASHYRMGIPLASSAIWQRKRSKSDCSEDCSASESSKHRAP